MVRMVDLVHLVGKLSGILTEQELFEVLPLRHFRRHWSPSLLEQLDLVRPAFLTQLVDSHGVSDEKGQRMGMSG